MASHFTKRLASSDPESREALWCVKTHYATRRILYAKLDNPSIIYLKDNIQNPIKRAITTGLAYGQRDSLSFQSQFNLCIQIRIIFNILFGSYSTLNDDLQNLEMAVVKRLIFLILRIF